MSRRTGHEALYSRVVEMDVKAKEQELIEKEVNKFFCEGGAIRCPVCDCQPEEPVSRKVEAAEDLYERLGWEKPSKEQRERNLESNLRHYTCSLEIE